MVKRKHHVIGAIVVAIWRPLPRLELDGLIAPSARWNCDNVMLFMPGSDWRVRWRFETLCKWIGGPGCGSTLAAEYQFPNDGAFDA